MSCLNNYNLDVILNQLNCWCLQWRGKIATVFPSGMTQIEQIQELFTAVKNCCEAQIEVMERFCELYNFVNDYFKNLDIQEEINNKIDEMIKDGSFNTILVPIVSQYATPHFVDSTSEMTNINYLYILNETGNVWYYNGETFIDSGVQYIGGISNLLRNYGILPNNTDLNTISVNGSYIINSTYEYINSPVTSGNLLNFFYNYNLSVQVIYNFTTGYMFYRKKVAGKWDTWKTPLLGLNTNDLSDANLAMQTSLYIVDSATLNLPAKVSGFLFTYGSETSAKVQLFIEYTRGICHQRTYDVTEKTWNEWNTFSYANNAMSYVGALTSDIVDELKNNTIYIYNPSTFPIESLPFQNNAYIITTGSPNSKYQLMISTSTGRTFFRNFSVDTWSSWRSYCFNYISAGNITDCNLALSNGYYILNPGEIDNLPVESTGYLFTYGLDTASRIQFYTVYSTGDIYYRRTLTPFNENKYTEWRKLNESSSGIKTNGTMISFGNSILTGSVWKDEQFDHLSSYLNSPYGNIATAMNVSEDNVKHTMLSSTGLIYDAGQGSFLVNIKNTDLKPYDVLLTHLWTRDMDSNLGDVNSTDNDGTIAGGVVSLINYMKENNPMAQLILVGVPPVSTTISGDEVFTGNYPNGKSLNDCNTVMAALAEKYHFVYIPWNDLNISYYFRSFTDGQNVHANNEDTYRIMGAYLGGRACSKISF